MASQEGEDDLIEHQTDVELAARSETTAALESLLTQSAREATQTSAASLECCCGRKDCAFLKHNATALDGLEKDVQTAAQLGQALLVRHEAYMVDAEQERLRLGGTIEQLESDKQALQAENAKTIEENRDLLRQLEELNGTVADSDTHIKALNATLESTQLELRRLTGLASRASELEIQLAMLEQEQNLLQQNLSSTQEQERSAVQRWKNAERTLGNLEDQIEKIEKESREERERHVEILGRLERRRAVERELDSAAGRLKGAAQWKTTGNGKDGSNVVSHFVKDILQDNANLQMGVMELREMLLSSNEEVENLREQLMVHQPVSLEGDDSKEPGPLSKELESESAKNAMQELHVHHHYHAPETGAKDKAPIRRPKRKRNVISPGVFTPPSGSQTPRTSRAHSGRPVPATSTSAAILSQTAVSLPPASPPTTTNRCSMQSMQRRSSVAQSSVPSSPQSAFRYSSIFDRTFSDIAADSSRPTTPESVDPASPLFPPTHRKQGSEASFRSFKVPANNLSKIPILPPPSRQLHPPAEKHEDVDTSADLNTIADLNLAPTGEDMSAPSKEAESSTVKRPSLDTNDSSRMNDTSEQDGFYSRQLHRSSSHESLLSVSGMDIHLSRDHPSHRFLKAGSFSPTAPRGFSTPSTSVLSSQPVLSSETAFAQRPSLSRGRYDSSTYNRSLLRSHTSSTTQDRAGTNITPEEQDGATLTAGAAPLGRRVGGWVFGKWGVTPMASTGNLRGQAAASFSRWRPPTTSPAASESQEKPLRAPGVNQAGPIRGLRPSAAKLASNVQVTQIDEELLRESLAEG